MLYKSISIILIALNCCLLSCNAQPAVRSTNQQTQIPQNKAISFDTSYTTIHILVALCDNKYQGIVPVPAKIGNGQDPANNLYWGAAYGIKTYFNKSKEWELVEKRTANDTILERLVFKHKTHKNTLLIADAYDGKYIQQCTDQFLMNSAGKHKDTLMFNNKTIGIASNAKLNAYIGHDGLMDFQLENQYQNEDAIQRDVIILACYSKRFFGPYLKQSKVNPIVWTSHLMAPEAYIIHDALSAYLLKASAETVRQKAAAAYSHYQKCSLKAANNLLVGGW